MPDYYARHAARPLPKAPAPSPTTHPVPIAPCALTPRLFLAAVFTGLTVFYISGYVRLTAANYQKVRLLRKVQALEAQRQYLHSERVRRSEKETVERWAEANKMVRPSLPPVIVGSVRISSFTSDVERE
jgi:hypothetical protein